MKKIISILTTFALVMGIFFSTPMTAYAYLTFDLSEGNTGKVGDYRKQEDYSNEEDGKNIIYEFDELTGTLTLTGEGKMANFATSPFYGKKAIKHLIVGEGITRLCEGAFYGCTGMIDVKLPTTLSTILEDTFALCTSLEGVELKGTVRK